MTTSNHTTTMVSTRRKSPMDPSKSRTANTLTNGGASLTTSPTTSVRNSSSTPSMSAAASTSSSNNNNNKSAKSTRFKLVTNKERRKEFDEAVRDVMRQRKQATQLHHAVLKAQRRLKAEKEAEFLLAMAGESKSSRHSSLTRGPPQQHQQQQQQQQSQQPNEQKQPRRRSGSLNVTALSSAQIESLSKLRNEYRRDSSGVGSSSNHRSGSYGGNSVGSTGGMSNSNHSTNSNKYKRVQSNAEMHPYRLSSETSSATASIKRVSSEEFVPIKCAPRKPRRLSALSTGGATGNEDENDGGKSIGETTGGLRGSTLNATGNSQMRAKATTANELDARRPTGENSSETDGGSGNRPAQDASIPRRRGTERHSVTRSMNDSTLAFNLDELEPTKRKLRESSAGSNASNSKNDSESEDERERKRDPFYIPPFKPQKTPLPSSNLPQSMNGNAKSAYSKAAESSTNSTPSTSLRSLENYKLEDLIPTKKTEMTKKKSIYDDEEEGDKKKAWKVAPSENDFGDEVSTDCIQHANNDGAYNESDSCNNISTDKLKSLVGRWRSKSLTFGEEIDFNKGKSDDELDVTVESIEVVSGSEPISLTKTFPPNEISDNERVANTDQKAPLTSKSVAEKCRRNWLLNSQFKSHSGATGITTSTSSMKSSDSFSSHNNPALANGNGHSAYCGAGSVIMEEEFRSSVKSVKSSRRGSGGDNSVAQSTSEISCNKSQQSRVSTRSKLSQFTSLSKRNVFKRLLSTPANIVGEKKRERGQQVARRGHSFQDNVHFNEEDAPLRDEISGSGRGLNRKTSVRSISSTMSSITNGSNATGLRARKSSRWNFRQRRSSPKTEDDTDSAGPPTRVIVTNDGKDGNSAGDRSGVSFRNQSMNFSQRGSASSVSRLSHQSSKSLTEDDSSQLSRFSDFYDNSAHIHAVTRVLLKNGSKRSIHSTSLHPVKEQAEAGSIDAQNSPKLHDDYDNHSVGSNSTDSSAHTLYRYPAHPHDLVHVCPKSLFPDTPGWQCDECGKETFDLSLWAYVSTQENYLVCGECFSKSGFQIR